MKKIFFIVSIALSFSVNANLWCAYSSIGETPSNLGSIVAYESIQVDVLSDFKIQIDLQDNYNMENRVFNTYFQKKPFEEVLKINGVLIGTYESSQRNPEHIVNIKVNDAGEILLSIGEKINYIYNCEAL